MRLAKKVRGTVEASESFRGKLVKTMGEEALCCITSCIYQREEDQSFSIRSLQNLKLLARNGYTKIEGVEGRLPNVKKVVSRTTNYDYVDQWVVPSATKDVIQFIGLECSVFILSNKHSILSFMPFAEGEIPVKYLGVPLIFSCLLNKDCKILVERVKNRVGDWKNKLLSFAGQLQLCKSVISSMHVYWASVLMIPIGIIQDIQQFMRGFLWCNGDLKRGKAKVTWEDICLPKSEGGLDLCGRLLDRGVLKSIGSVVWFSHCMDLVPPSMQDIILELQPMAHKRTAKSVVGHILVAVTSYFIWLERNNRLFKNVKRPTKEFRDTIMVTVRLKLLIFQFKNTAMVNQLLLRWKMPKSFRLYS
ncbi:hypothetical protein Tco_1228958 [Tanacetum coccineum]